MTDFPIPFHTPQLVNSLHFIYLKPEKDAPFTRSLPVEAITGSTPAWGPRCSVMLFVYESHSNSISKYDS